LYSPLIQSAFAPQESREGDIKEVGGNIYVKNNETGQWENRGTAAQAAESMTADERYKLLNQQQWKQSYDVSNQYKGMMSSTLSPFLKSGESWNPFDFSKGSYDKIDWNGVANKKPSIDTIVGSAYRMLYPDLTRINPDGSVVDSGSLTGMISQKVNELANDADGAPLKVRDLVDEAFRRFQTTQSSYQTNLNDFNSRFPETQNNFYEIPPPKVSGGAATASTIAAAIKKVESGGNYNAKGASGEFGAYQFMPSTWTSWAGKYLGNPNAPMTQANQDKVAMAKITDLLNQGYNAEQIALIWNGGTPQVKKGVNQYGVAYDSGAYARKVLSSIS
jgi:muramidase (phage lysozyme)